MECKCIIGNINSISDISNKFLDKKIKKDNLPVLRNHIKLFYIIPQKGDKMLFNELSKIWGISKSSLSDIIYKYENLGFIEKNECKNDKRTVYLNLTEKAIPIINKLDSYEEEFLDILLHDFGDEAIIFKENLFKALKNINKIL